jgi:hypothetical protein
MAKKASRARHRAALRTAKRVTLRQHLKRIQTVADASTAHGEERGACLVTDPQTGQNRCIRTTPTACKALKGAFIGGPCGG